LAQGEPIRLQLIHGWDLTRIALQPEAGQWCTRAVQTPFDTQLLLGCLHDCNSLAKRKCPAALVSLEV